MEQKILLIDGNSILHRAFYGYPEFINKEGKMLQGVFGFINIMNKHINEVNPTHIAVSFDLPQETFRHVMYADYKGTRGPAPAGLTDNFEPLQTLLSLIGIQWIAIPGYEGDDVLGTLSRKFHKENLKSVILSGDKDIFQLIDEYTTVRFPKTIKGEKVTYIYDHDKFVSEFGVEPLQYIDLKALMGDLGDNIPGVNGIGSKTAQKIIASYGCIENAYEYASDIKPKKYGDLLVEQYEMAKFSKILATIKTDIPIDISLDNLKFNSKWPDTVIAYLDKLGITNKVWMQK